jgi:transcriptional regulator with XRE-family HTH domain
MKNLQMLQFTVIFVNKFRTKMKQRIEQIMRHYNLTAAQFATEIGIQRSALSHIMSGRNKPSLDFVLKVKHRYSEINTDWLLLGKGKIIAVEQKNEQNGIVKNTISDFKNNVSEEMLEQSKVDKKPTIPVLKEKKKSPLSDDNGDSEIEKIIFFYKSGEFKIFKPNKD